MAGKCTKKTLYTRPPPIPKGEIITDISTKKTWKLGDPVGVGGFGDIYSAAPNDDTKGTYNFVVKVEPHENGPLFVEKNFYIRNATEKDIKDYMKTNKLTSLGMPTYYGQGSHEINGHKYRFLVLERYGMNIWDIFEKSNKSFSPATVFILGSQILEVLKYIHEHGYVHADIKGGNVLMGRRKGTENQAYLVDFGLATRLTDKEYKPDPKSAHNGTLEYTSRDAHRGGPTMRGDLEILAYNMLQWITGTLPWLNKSAEKQKKQNLVANAVMQMKIEFMEDVRIKIKNNYPSVPDALIIFFEHINTLNESDVPDYAKCQKIFLDYLKSVGKNKNSKLEFKSNTKHNKNEDVVSKADDDVEQNDSNHVVVKKRGRKVKVNPEINDDSQNAVPVNAKKSQKKAITNSKRKSFEPQAVVQLKRLKTSEMVTPPAKKNHTHIATQTSVERRSPRHVSFDSPISEVLGEKPTPNGSEVVNSSQDIFDDSIGEKKKVKKKRKLLATQQITVKKVVSKKVTTGKGKSWKDAPAIVNGRSPQK